MTTSARRPRPRDPAAVSSLPPGPAPAGRAGVGRRALLAGAPAALALAGCAPPVPPSGSSADPSLPSDRSAAERTVAWASWTAYLDRDEATRTWPTLQEFTRRTGIRASYTEEIDDNDGYVSKLAPRLRAGQDVGRDLVVLTDWMAARLIRDRLVAPLELIRMPHVTNLRDSLKDVSFDPGRRFSLPWQSGMTGVCWDSSRTAPVRTVADLWRPDLRGRVVVLSEMRDTVGVILQSQGVDITGPFTREQVERAFEEVDRRIGDGSIRRVKGNSYLQDLRSGNALAGIVWSGDLLSLREEAGGGRWRFAIPESGGTLWSDNLLIPVTARHRRNAQRLIDFYYDPQVAARVAAHVRYVCPVQGAQEVLARTDPRLAHDPLVFPTEQWLREHRVQVFRALTPAEDAEYSQRWTQVVGG